jgi:hypothetical protein
MAHFPSYRKDFYFAIGSVNDVEQEPIHWFGIIGTFYLSSPFIAANSDRGTITMDSVFH